MKNLIGFRIRQARLAQGLSQQTLCRGVCAVSYLSKIEQGQAEPGADIVRLLFQRLGIAYEDDPVFLEENRALLRTFFERMLQDRPCPEEAEALRARGERLDHSPLCLQYRLALCWRGNPAEIEAQLPRLTPYADYMEGKTRFLYELMLGWHAPLEEALVHLRRAEDLRPCAAVSRAAAARLYQEGRYQEALPHCAQGYDRAAREGSVPLMWALSFTEANCYANLFNHPLMLHAFERAAALAHGDPAALAEIDYNIGASFLEKGRYPDALPRLERARQVLCAPDGGAEADRQALIYHKLAICLMELGRGDEAARLLAEGRRAADGLPEIYGRMLRAAELRLDPRHDDNDEYFALLRALCGALKGELHYGFRQFHLRFLLEALEHRRLYKEAAQLLRETSPMFSDN